MTFLDTSDKNLISLTLQGDEAAFGALIGRHKIWLYQFVCRYVPDAEDACDLVQESFISAWRALARYDPEIPFPIWLRRIALNKCRDRARRLSVRRFLLPWDTSSVETTAIDPSARPDEALMDKELAQIVQAAIDGLPRRLKDSLVLTMLEGLTHAEAATVLGITAKAVEGRVSRAKKRLTPTLDCSLIFGEGHTHDHD